MTRPEEHENDQQVLDFLGFGTPAQLEPVVPPAVTANPMAAAGADRVPMTRRELRQMEHAGEIEPARRSLEKPPTRGKKPPRRTAKNSTRRDAVRVAAAKPKTTIGKRLTQFGAMLFAGSLAFGMAIPAFAGGWEADSPQLAESLALPAQSVEVDPTLVSFAERDTWSVTSWAEMLKLRYGNRDFSYTTGNGPIRWPFPYPVPISSGFGDRAAPCRGCSSVHMGLDFTPGNGTPIFAIADGVVAEHIEGGGFGNYVVIRHEIDGQVVYSGYAHMQYGSSPLAVGQQILVGDFVGLVGSTGISTGAHLHFNIAIGDMGNYVDPFTFLKRYAV